MKYLRQFEGADTPVVLVAQCAKADAAGGGPSQLLQQFHDFAAALRTSMGDAGSFVMGMLQKETHTGPFAAAFVKTVPSFEGVQLAECKDAVSSLLSVKEADELALVKKA